MPRTNNVAEGWHNAFATMTGAKRPTILKFVEGIKKDEDIARTKIIACSSGGSPKPQKPRDAEKNVAIKTSVLMYLQKKEAAAKKAAEEESAMEEEEIEVESSDDEQEKSSNQWSRSSDENSKWQKTPEYFLLKAIGKNHKF